MKTAAIWDASDTNVVGAALAREGNGARMVISYSGNSCHSWLKKWKRREKGGRVRISRTSALVCSYFANYNV